MKIHITRGLESSDKNFIAVDVNDVEAFLNKHKDCYERTMPDEPDSERTMNRAYIDLDGAAPYHTHEDDFNTLHTSILEKLSVVMEGNSLVHSSKWNTQHPKSKEKSHKLSYSLVYTRLHGTKADIDHFVRHTVLPQLQAALKGIITVSLTKKSTEEVPHLSIDMAVYNKGNRKMRMVGSSKNHKNISENRPKICVIGNVTDSLITYIPDDCELLPTPPPKFIKAPANILSDSTTVGDATISADIEEDEDEKKNLLTTVILALNASRVTYHPDWIKLGMIMKNEGFDVADYVEFSRRSTKFCESSPDYIRDQWNSFKRNGLTQATLWKWLRDDNMDVFTSLQSKRNDFRNLIHSTSQAKVARYFYNLKTDSYIFNEKLGWYQLQPSNIWKSNEGKTPSGLKADINVTMTELAMEQLALLPSECADEDESKAIMSFRNKIKKFIVSIGTSGFVDGVIAFLPSAYNDDDFYNKLDESRHLLAFTNAVYDLEIMAPRAIQPRDYISLTTGYAFPYERFPEAREQLVDCLRSIFESQTDIDASSTMGELAKAFLHSVASTLHGRNKYERFYVWTGNGGNGKGLLNDIVSRALGDYYHTIPNSVLTKSQDKKDAPCPPLAHAKSKRFLVASEPESQDKLQVGIIKELTGGDKITVRDLHKTTVQYIPQFGLFLMCNGIPLLNRADGGAQRRIRVFIFPNKFVANPTEPYHKPMNPHLKDLIKKDDKMRSEMLHLLLEAYQQIKTEGLCEPESILEASRDYMDENNPIRGWLEANYETGLDATNKSFFINTTEFRKEFEASTGADINAEKFKACMLLCDGVYKNIKHPFKIERNGEEITMPCGRYWAGLRKK